MRYALLDNSTLTGVQRLLGEIPIKNKSVVDMDILCLESLIEAILFYDTIITIDDYKESYRKSRQKAFPQIMTIDRDILPMNTLLVQTKKIADTIIPRVEAGHFVDNDFKPFFDLLKMNVICTWDMSGSEYFLTQKMLADTGGIGIEKYSHLSSTIYSELIDKRRANHTGNENSKVVLLDHYGKPISPFVTDKWGNQQPADLSKQINAFFDGLNWLAFRTIFYTLAANNLGVDLFLHPIRQAFQPNFLTKLNQEDLSTFKPVIDAMSEQANSSINKILGRTTPFVTKRNIPLFVTWFAEKVGDPRKYIEYAFELRQEAPFVDARKRLIELEASVESGSFITEANSLIFDVEKSFDSVLSKYSANTSQGVSISSLITLWNLAAVVTPLPKIPNMDLRIKKLEFMKHLIPQTGFKSVYRSVIDDLVQVSHLGEHYETISSMIQLDKNADTYLDKEEPAHLSKRKSHWKLPM